MKNDNCQSKQKPKHDNQPLFELFGFAPRADNPSGGFLKLQSLGGSVTLLPGPM